MGNRDQSQLNLPPVPVQKHSPARETSAPPEVQALSLTQILADCVHESGCSEKVAALSQGYPPSYWSRIKSGEKRAHLDPIGKLPVHVQREFVTRYARQLQLRVSDEDRARAAIGALLSAAANAMREIG